MTIPRCPKCGEPAQVIIVIKARVRCILNDDGSAGKVLSTSRDRAGAIEYECSGVHTWAVEAS